MVAFLSQLSGLREVALRCGHLLKTANFSSISHALSRKFFLEYVGKMVKLLETLHCPGSNELVALDSMAITLPKTQRHRCPKFNNKTVGGGVLWAYMVQAKKDVIPVKIIKVIEGAWHDSKLMQGVKLISKGPVYLMDRGFYAFHLLNQFTKDKVRFIVRVRKHDLQYSVIGKISEPRKIGSIKITLDAKVRLGGAQSKLNPEVRLIIATLASGEDLILATNLYTWSTERILESYKKRQHIERFHKFIKDSLGLAHLYSFSQTGLMFLLYTALLIALLLFLMGKNSEKELIYILRSRLKIVRKELGLGTRWKRNICTAKRQKRKERKNA